MASEDQQSGGVSSGHFRLSAEQRRFKDTLSGYPRLMPYWDFETRECRLELLRRDMDTLSQGERLMARFFAAVWLGENVLGFDLIEAARTLDDPHRALIQRWFTQPEFP